MTGTRDCTCESCVAACAREPGWFGPGQADRLLAAGRITRDELIVDYWIDGLDHVYVYAPRKRKPNGEIAEPYRDVASWGYAFEPGRCVFLTKDDRCRIHSGKPIECRAALCCRGPDDGDPRGERSEIAALWRASGNPLARVVAGEESPT